jgi:NADH:ubiquinone oxidoreductase subunit 3 (subunit A)
VELQLLREKWGLLLAGLIFQVSCASLLPWSLVAAGIINFIRALLLLVCTLAVLNY